MEKSNNCVNDSIRKNKSKYQGKGKKTSGVSIKDKCEENTECENNNKCNNLECGRCATAEGITTQAKGSASHSEGYRTIAEGLASHAEGSMTRSTNEGAHAEGILTDASGEASHSEGNTTKASGDNSHAEGNGTKAMGNNSHAEGNDTQATSNFSHAEGDATMVLGIASHAEGNSNTATGDFSHAEGSMNQANNIAAHVEGMSNLAEGEYSHAEGSQSIAGGEASHAEGVYTIASGYSSHAQGYSTNANGMAGCAEGAFTETLGFASHAEGFYTKANNYGNHIMGKFGVDNIIVNPSIPNEQYSWYLANGLNPDLLGLAAKILNSGNAYIDKNWNSGGADYAEMFETIDGGSIEPGYFVTLDGEKVRIANENDSYILGVISVTPSIVGNAAELKWKNKFLTDEWDRVIYEDVKVDAILDKEGKEIKPEGIEKQPIINPSYNSKVEYIPRRYREEWVMVGMLGQVLVRDDGSCEVNKNCKVNSKGIATKSDNSGYRVMKRTGKNQILILFR